ncbi:MAG: DNA methyltransferase [Candidatus Anstonellales archaeon]
MEVQEILLGKEKLVSYLKDRGFQEEKDYYDDEYREGTYLKIDKKKLLVVYEVFEEDKIKEIKDHFLIDRGLSYCILILKGKLIFFRNFGETKHFIYSERTKNNVSKIDKLKNMSNLDLLFQSKDISALFYEAFKVKRNLLVKNIKNNLEPVQKYLIAQKIFDRFFFIYFLCHKGIIKFKDGGKISGENLFTKILLKNGRFLENLKKLFHMFNSQEKNILEIGDYQIVIPYLNGGLFRPDILEQDLDIDLKDEQWKEIFDFLNSYHWIIEDVKATEDNEEKILTPEILGHVYERSVVEWESEGFEKEAENAFKNITERKKKGVYYTSESITDYISKNTIIPYLLDKLGNKYASFDDLIESKNKEDMKNALKILDKIKVLDPACGSGAFLIKTSEVIFGLKRRLYYELKEKKNFYDMKFDIITENIYGVDILAGAIEIAKLRLWLWLISDFEEAKNEIKALPNIEYNLKVGNSLVGWLDENLIQMPMNTPLTEKVDEMFVILVALSEGKDIEEIKKARNLLDTYKLNDYIEAYYILYKIYRKTHGLKAEHLKTILETIRDSIYAKINPLFLDYINKKINKNYDFKKPPITQEEFSRLKAFHWRIDFGHIMKNGGFDIVVGNPPYVGFKQSKKLERYIFEQLYKRIFNGKNDYLYYFIYRGKCLLNENCYVGFITSRYFLESDYGNKLRSFLQKDTQIKQIIDFYGVNNIFQNINIHPLLIIYKNNLYERNIIKVCRVAYVSNELDVSEMISKIQNNMIDEKSDFYMDCFCMYQKDLEETGWCLACEDELNLLKKINSESINLSKICNTNQGIITGADEIFIIPNKQKLAELKLNDKELSLFKKWVKNSNILKWVVSWGGEYLLYADPSFKEDNYPNIKKYLLLNKNTLLKRVGKSYGWQRLHRAREISVFESKDKKIVVPYKSKEPRFSLDDKNYFFSADVYAINIRKEYKDIISIELLLGILNSQLIEFWIKKNAKRMGEVYEFYPYMFNRLPIKLPDKEDKNTVIKIEVLVSEIIKSALNNEDYSNKYKQLNELIFDYYKITDEKDKKIIRRICSKF